MKLSEAFPNIAGFSTLRELYLHTPQHGSISSDGRLITPPQSPQINVPISAEENQHGPRRETDYGQSTGHSPRDKMLLLEALEKVCALQKQYGKTHAELETLVEGFSWALSNHQMPVIIGALKTYILRHNDIPAPADILRIIDPPAPDPEPLSAAMYVEIKNRIRDGNVYVTDEQKRYCNAYEKQEMAKVKG